MSSKQYEEATCEICYSSFAQPERSQHSSLFEESNKMQWQAVDTEGLPKGLWLAECKHAFCADCVREHFRSFIVEQNKYDNLKCPQHDCEAKVRDDDELR